MKFKIALKTSLLIFYFFTIFQASAQDSLKTITEVKSLTKYKLYLLGTGLEREQKISKQSTLYFIIAIETVAPFYPKQPRNASDVLGIDYLINFAPIIGFGFRNYYNLSEREKLNKTTANNSALFFGVEYNLIAPILINKRYTTNYIHSTSPIWGFQKNTSKNVNIELAIGPSFQTEFEKRRVSLLGRIGLNYLL